MGSKKVEEKLQTLIHAFYEQKELSAKDIQNLLVCNRASTYNYIERLKERGFELESTTRNKTAYYTLISEDPSAPPVYYLPISKEILRKYNVIQNLQRKHDTAKLLKDRYFLPGNNKIRPAGQRPAGRNKKQYVLFLHGIVHTHSRLSPLPGDGFF